MTLSVITLDALVVGAGFGGIYQLYKLRQLGLSVKVIDKAGDVGGTWYWNRYPGAMSDTESYIYRYSWDTEDLKTYPWTHHYLRQPEILKYLEHVVEKYDLRRHMHFNTELRSATWDADKVVWRAVVGAGRVIEARYLITALGLLSAPKYPDIPGIDSFKGELCHTSAWKPEYQVKNKRVGVIGCGSTGVQVITEIAPQVQYLACFQRHPQYSVPSGNKSVAPEYRQWVNDNYEEIMAGLRKTATSFGFEESTTSFHDVPPAEREGIFQRQWDGGNGFKFMFGGFSDITTDLEANEAACNFVRSKISQIVQDPQKARKLMPRELYARRPLCDGGYYEQFNRPNVDIVNLQETPIASITPTGIATRDGKHYDLDMIICATGFNAMDGSYKQIAFRGKTGETLQERWSEGTISYLGCFVPDFPNLFMLSGPQGPFTNLPPAIEVHVELITTLIQQAEEARARMGTPIVEALPEAAAKWVAMCDSMASQTLFVREGSWMRTLRGSKRPTVQFYMGGMMNYMEHVRKLLDHHKGLKPIVGYKRPSTKGRSSTL